MYPDQDLNEVFGSNSPYNGGKSAGQSFLQTSGLNNAPKVLLNGMPLDDAGVRITLKMH